MQADDWKAARERREATRATLANFRDELPRNRALVAEQTPYHQRLQRALLTQFRSPPPDVPTLFNRIRWEGMKATSPARTAWDLAIATQALSYVEPQLAFAVADVYQRQTRLVALNSEFSTSAFTPQTLAQPSAMPFMMSLSVWLGDVGLNAEPRRLEADDQRLPRVGAALARLAR